MINFVTFNTKIIDIDEDIARDSGVIKNSLRKKHSDFGLIDAIVLATARKKDSKLVTGNPHLITEDDVVDIRKNLGFYKTDA